MVRGGAQCTMTSTPTPERIRLTITVTPEVHAVFTRFASANRLSLGRAMGDWLGDTVDAVDFVSDKVERARAAPAHAMREMQAFARGLVVEVDELAGTVEAGGRPADAQRPPDAPLSPRPVIRGVKVSGAPRRTGGKGS